jgi:hypothetical protein
MARLAKEQIAATTPVVDLRLGPTVSEATGLTGDIPFKPHF